VQPIGKHDPGQVNRVRATLAQFAHEPPGASPQARIVPHAREMDGERRPPPARAQYGDLMNDVPQQPAAGS
jgi:hypothetical protein